MFREDFMDDIFEQNVYDINREMIGKERQELQNIPQCDLKLLDERIANCKKIAHCKKMTSTKKISLLHEHVSVNRARLEKRREIAQFHQMHRRVLELRHNPEATRGKKMPKVQSMHLQHLKYTLGSKLQQEELLKRQIQNLRAQIGYTDDQHWGLENHIKQLEKSLSTRNEAKRLRLYSDLLVELLSLDEEILNTQNDVEWAEKVQGNQQVKRVVRKILRNDYTLQKLDQLRCEPEFEEKYTALVAKQQHNRKRLETLVASCSPN